MLKGDRSALRADRSLFEPAHHVQALSLLIKQGNLLHGQAHHHVGPAHQRVGPLPAAAVAPVGHQHIARANHEQLKGFSRVPVGYPHVDQACCQQVIAQMHPPVIATAPGLFEPGAIDEQDARHAGGWATAGQARHGQQFAQQPQ